jgi:hypothetical protein
MKMLFSIIKILRWGTKHISKIVFR